MFWKIRQVSRDPKQERMVWRATSIRGCESFYFCVSASTTGASDEKHENTFNIFYIPHASVTSENKPENQISTVQPASSMLALWHTHPFKERTKVCFARRALCERRRRERGNSERFRWCLSWNCLKIDYQANVFAHHLRVSKYPKRKF